MTRVAVQPVSRVEVQPVSRVEVRPVTGVEVRLHRSVIRTDSVSTF